MKIIHLEKWDTVKLYLLVAIKYRINHMKNTSIFLSKLGYIYSAFSIIGMYQLYK